MITEKVLAFAKSLGYDDAEHKGKWKNYDVYEATIKTDEPINVGKPTFIFVEGDDVFVAPEEEMFAYIDSLPEDAE